jgi:hypothetical protein
MSPAIKYTLARAGMFVVFAVALQPLHMNLLVQLTIALAVTAVVSYFLLRKWRDEMAVNIERSMSHRRQEKQRLRAALSGDDEPEK